MSNEKELDEKNKRWKWDKPMTKKEQMNMINFIKHLNEGYHRYCKGEGENGEDDKYINHIISITVRHTTGIIGRSNKNLKISEKALSLLGLNEHADFKAIVRERRNNPGETILEHYKPANYFFNELKDKPFKDKDAKRWLNEAVIAIITKKEDEKLTKNGYGTRRDNPEEAYKDKKVAIELVTVAT